MDTKKRTTIWVRYDSEYGGELIIQYGDLKGLAEDHDNLVEVDEDFLTELRNAHACWMQAQQKLAEMAGLPVPRHTPWMNDMYG